MHVFSDATITVPLIVQAQLALGKRRKEHSRLRLEGRRAGAEVRNEIGRAAGVSVRILFFPLIGSLVQRG
jgi:hypothetical protein